MRLLALVLVVGGCAIGAGTSTVGIWRPHRQVDTVVCIEDPPGRCAKTVQVARDIPARSFGGGVLAWFNPGYLRLRDSDGATRDRFALDSHYEYLRGRGGVALGVRIGANIGIGMPGSFFTLPVTLVGHWGFPRWSLYGGAGYTPYASDNTTVNDVATTTRRDGFHVMGGGRILLRAGRDTRMTASIDVFRQYLDGTVATSATTAIGIHL